MMCPKCGAMVEDAIKTCDNCGYEFSDTSPVAETDGSEYNININAPALADSFKPVKKVNITRNRLFAIILLIISISIVIITFYGAHFMSIAGKNINGMQSISSSLFGFSSGVDASYYKNLGAAIYGFSYVVRGIGLALGTHVASFIKKLDIK